MTLARQEVIDELNALITCDTSDNYDRAVADCMEIFKKHAFDEPQKPVVPKWFDEWVKKNIVPERRTYSRLYELFSDELAMELTLEQNDWIESHIDGVIRAILDGYEVEKEKLYWVRMPINDYFIYMMKNKAEDSQHFGKIGFCSEEFKDRQSTHFTEEEIKDYDERYWAFAVPVEEVEE